MGAFALIRKDAPDLPDRIGAVFRKRGFPTPRRIDTRNHILLLADKIISPTPNFFSDESGDFAAVTGTIFYRESFGLQALAHLLADAKSDRIDEHAFFGNFAVILKTGLKLSLFGDGLGSYRIYKTADDAVWSSSLLACLSTIPEPEFEPQGVQEYIFTGATYGEGTLIKGISLLDPKASIRLEPSLLSEPRDLDLEISVTADSLETHVERTLAALRRNARSMALAFGSSIDVELSGDADTRLTLALLKAQGLRPKVNPVGGPNDRKVANRIANGEGLKLSPDFKIDSENIDSTEINDETISRFWAMDGHPPKGCITPFKSPFVESDNRPLNSKGAQVLHNYLGLPPRAFYLQTVRKLMFGSSPGFSTLCEQVIDRKLLDALSHSPKELTRVQIEYLYPAFMGRFHQGLDLSIANCFAPAASLYLDLSVVRETLRVPMRYKNHDIFVAALISAIDPRLANYPTAGGYDLLGHPPLRKRLGDWLGYIVQPLIPGIRRTSEDADKSPVIDRSLRSSLFPDGTPAMDRHVTPATVHGNDKMNRLLTLEIMAREASVR